MSNEVDVNPVEIAKKIVELGILRERYYQEMVAVLDQKKNAMVEANRVAQVTVELSSLFGPRYENILLIAEMLLKTLEGNQ